MLKDKQISVCFLQETHTDERNEADWGLWWKGKHVLSHGSNVSAGVAVLIAPALTVKVLGVSVCVCVCVRSM